MDLNALNQYGVPLHACHGYKHDAHYWEYVGFRLKHDYHVWAFLSHKYSEPLSEFFMTSPEIIEAAKARMKQPPVLAPIEA